MRKFTHAKEAPLKFRSRKKWPILPALVVILILAYVPGKTVHKATADTKPNIIFVLTDDQRWDTLWAMPTVESELVAKGMTFNDYFYTNPLCCPSRAGILTGKSSRYTGCWWVDSSCFSTFEAQESTDIAPILSGQGYYTGLIGKYLNSYTSTNTSHVPPGWNRWAALTADNYYNYTMSVDGKSVSYGSATTDYQTDVLANYADDLIRNRAPATQPLFLYFAPHSPHAPATPPPRYSNSFSNLAPYRPPNFNEQDVSDKPAWVRKRALMSSSTIASNDKFRIKQYQSDLGIDDAVAKILKALSDTGRTNNLIIFVSDNGMEWGEHRLSKVKSNPYEEVIRGPMVVRWDGVVPARSQDNHSVLNLDFAPTWAEVAGTSLSGTGIDGVSLLSLFNQTATSWRNDFYIEHAGGSGLPPAFCGVRNSSYKYIKYPYSGEEELYDLNADPYELQNQAKNTAYASQLAAMQQRHSQICVNPPKGKKSSGGGGILSP